MRSLLALSFALASPLSAQSLEYRTLEVSGGSPLRYAVALPDGYDEHAYHPLLLALPPGDQSEKDVEDIAQLYFAPLRTRGWVVVSPVAPEGASFQDGGERLLPPLLARLRETFHIEGARVHLCGVSNGGRGAFRIATLAPHEFQSLVVLPGYADAADEKRLARLRDVRVRLFAGESDPWVQRVQATHARLREIGVDAELQVLAGEGHTPRSLAGEGLARVLEALRAAAVVPGAAGEVGAALDDFHDAAAQGDEDRYFGRFAPEAVFLGTDAGERWTLPEFKAFALPWFQRSSAWIYVPRARHVTLSPDGAVAWFDEVLGHAQYGTCRGTGALRKIEGRWCVALYDLTVPVPNELMGGVVQQIRSFADGEPPPSTTVILVRHCEKEADGGSDPPLSADGRARAAHLAQLLRSVPVTAVFTSELQRTQETVAPLCAAQSVTPKSVPASDARGLLRAVRAVTSGTVVVAGHSNTIPDLLRALGGPAIEIGDGDYGDLWLVTGVPESVRVVHLHFD